MENRRDEIMEKDDSGTASATMPGATESMAGKYLTFGLGEGVYGLRILKVQEIIGLINVTKVPRTPEYVRGVINLRGKVIPVMDLRQKFGMESKEDTNRTCIIVVQVAWEHDEITMGILVDEVSEVVDIGSDQIEDTPSFGVSVDTDFILGMGKVGDRVIMLLDSDKVLSGEELELSSQIADQV